MTNLKIEYLRIRKNNLRGGLMIRRVFTRIEMIRNIIEVRNYHGASRYYYQMFTYSAI